MIQAKKVLGQNFLIDQNKIKAIIESIPNISNSTIIEVGPGTGAITVPLVEKAKKVIAIEIDEDMIEILESKIKSDNFTLINRDILETSIDDLIDGTEATQFVSNLPYYISTKIMFKVAKNKNINSMSVMLQSELVDRIFASLNTKAYGRLTVAIGSLFNLVTKIKVPSTCFQPKPNVESGFIVLERKNIDFDIDEYLKFIKAAFSAKRKTLTNSLKNGLFPYIDEVFDYFKEHGIPLNIRSEQIPIETFLDIWKEINKKKNQE